MSARALSAAALVGAMLMPGMASAASFAIATTNVNLRAGPSTAYPAVNVVPSGQDVRVFGCLSNTSWCDVAYGPQRGWMSSNYIAYVESGRRYVGAPAVRYIAAPVVSFRVGSYWDDHYRDRSFYRERARWVSRGDFFDGPPPPPPPPPGHWRPRPPRDDWRTREEWRGLPAEWRGGREDWRDRDRRDGWRNVDARDRAEWRDRERERRADWRDNRERREEWRDARRDHDRRDGDRREWRRHAPDGEFSRDF